LLTAKSKKLKILFTHKVEPPPFKSRKFKKNNSTFLKDYNLTTFSWSIIRIKIDKIIDENIGRIIMPKETLSSGINNSAILNELAQGVEILSSQIVDKDYLIIEEKFVYESIKNIPRRGMFGYLSFQYCNNIWTSETGHQFYQEIELVDKGSIVLSD
jgi:hypothetical protein